MFVELHRAHIILDEHPATCMYQTDNDLFEECDYMSFTTTSHPTTLFPPHLNPGRDGYYERKVSTPMPYR